MQVRCPHCHPLLEVAEVLPWNAIAEVAIGYTLVVLFTCPAVLGITEPLLWLGVWLVRWPVGRTPDRRASLCFRHVDIH